MTLTLSALSLNNQPLSQPVVAHFDRQGGTIGRSDQNTLTLPDAERHISRQHARITADGKGYHITNLSSANGLTVAGHTLGQGESAPIRHRDLVRIGGFLLEVRAVRANDPVALMITRGRAAAANEQAGPVDDAPADNNAVAALWSAFCEGAQLRLQPPQGLTPELMGEIGQILRSAIDGTLQMMAIRHEQRVDVPMRQACDNNPLKFSPDTQTAFEQLLQPPAHGLAGSAAMADAMHDLVGHTLGTAAGMRTALDDVLNRFAPTVLEGKLRPRSMVDVLLPMNRRSHLWALYLQHFEALRTEAQQDFPTLFQCAFLSACAQQVARPHEPQCGRPGDHIGHDAR